MNEFIIPWSKTVEVPITSVTAGGFLQFPINLDDLNNAQICGFEVISATELTTAPSGATVFAAADIPKVAITLALENGSVKKLDTIPAYCANRRLNYGSYFVTSKFKWNPSSSKINIMASGLTAAQSIIVVFYYIPQ